MDLEEEVDVIDPLDSQVVDVSFTLRELYMVLNTLYFDTANPPLEVLEMIKYLEDRLLDTGHPASAGEVSSEYVNDHSDTEQYKRLAVWLGE